MAAGTQTQVINIVVNAQGAQQGASVVQRSLQGIQQSANAANASVKVTGQQLAQLTPQINDLFVQIASGQGLFMPLIQQGPQITQIFGGLRNTLAAIPAPLLAAAAAAGTLAGAFALWNRHVESIRAVDSANRLMGNGLGLIRSGFEAMASSAAEAGRVSVNAARDMQAEFIKTGKISADAMSGLIAVVKDYAKATGQDAKAATTELAGLMRDPAKGAADLADKYNLLSDSQLQYIQRLAETGKRTEAQTALTAALAQRIKGAAEDTSVWAKAWGWLGTAASDAADAMGAAIDKAVNGPSLQERITKAQQYVNTLRQAREEEAALGAVDKSWKVGQSIGEAPNPAAAAASITPQVVQAEQALDDLLERQRELNRGNAFAQMTANAAAASRAAGDVVRGWDSVGTSIRNLEADAAKLGAVLQNSLALGMMDAADKAKLALSGVNSALDFMKQAQAQGISPETLKEKLTTEAEKKAAGMGPLERARFLARERTRIGLLDSTLPDPEKNQRVQNSLNATLAQQAQAAGDASKQLQLQAEAAKRSADAAGLGEAAQRRANIENQVAAAALQGLSAQTRAALEAQERYTRDGLVNGAVRETQRYAKLQGELAAAVAKGPAAQKDAELAAKAYGEALKVTTEDAADFNAVFQKFLDLQKQAANADFGVQIAKQTQSIEEAARKLHVLRGSLVGAPEDVKRAVEAQEQIRDWLRSQGKEYEKLNAAEKAQVDQLAEAARKNADLEAGIKRQEDAWKTVTDSLERAFDRLGGSLMDVFINGKGEAVKMGDVLRGIVSSIVSDLAKLAIANPIKNSLFGTNSATLFDLPMFGGGGTQGQAGAGQITSLAGGVGKQAASSWLSNKLFGEAGLTGWIDKAGYALGIGIPAATLVPTATVQASQIAMLQAANPGINPAVLAAGYEAPTVAAGGVGLSSYLGAAGIGAGIGGLLGPMLARGNKAMGGLIGAGSGAAAGALAGTFLFPGIGTALGALLGGAGGGLMGLFGTQKPSVGPNAGASIGLNSDLSEWHALTTGTDNGGDASASVQALQGMVQVLGTLKDSYAATIDKLSLEVSTFEKDGKTVWALNGWGDPEVSTAKDPAVAYRDILKWMALNKLDGQKVIPGTMLSFENADIMTAVKNSKAADINGLLADIDFASRFRDSIEAMTQALGLEDQARKAGKESAKTLTDQIVQFKTKTADLGLDLDAATKATRTWVDSLVAGTDPKTYTHSEAAVATLTAQWEAMGPVLEAVGYTAEEAGRKIQEGLSNNLKKIRDQALQEYDAALYAAQGRDYLTQLQGVADSRDTLLRNLTAAGVQDAAQRTETLVTEQAKAILRGLDAGQLDDVAATLSGAFGELARGMATTTRAAEAQAAAERARAADYSIMQRALAAQGRTYRAGLDAFDAQAMTDVREAMASGGDVGLLIATQRVERSKTSLDLIEQRIQDEIDARSRSVESIQATIQAWDQLVTSLADTRDALRIDKALSPLSPADRMTGAQRQLSDLFQKAMGGDAEAAQNFQTLAQSSLEATRAYYASSTQYADYFASVDGMLAQLGARFGNADDPQRRLVSETEAQTKALQDQLRAIQDQRRAIERVPASIDDLTAMARRELAGLQAALAQLTARFPATGLNNPVDAGLMAAIFRGTPVETRFGDGVADLWGTRINANRLVDIARALGYAGDVGNGGLTRALDGNADFKRRVLEAVATFNQASVAGLIGKIPGFSQGGVIGSVARIHNDELLYTGNPARVFNAADSARILGAANTNTTNDNAEVVAELRESNRLMRAQLYEANQQRAELIRLRAENARLRSRLEDQDAASPRTGTYR